MPLGSILGGVIGSGGSSGASAALNQGLQGSEQQQRANQTTLGPYNVSGINAQSKLDQLYGFGALLPDQAGGPGGWNVTGDPTGSYQKNALAQFQTTPGYQFRLQQGINSLDNSAASRGMLLSGAQTKGVQDYGQNTASAEFGNYINELNTMAGNGLSSATSLAGVNSGLQNGQNSLYGAQAGAAQAGANALASGIKGGFNSIVGGLQYGGSGGSFGLPGWI